MGMFPFRYFDWFGLFGLVFEFVHLVGLRKSSNMKKINNTNILSMKNGRNTNLEKKN